MTSGRIPTPTHLKILHGNPGGRPLNKREPRPAARRPQCPSWLSDEAKQVWRRTVADMTAMRTLAASDRESFVVLCEAVVHHRQACEIVDRAGVLIRYRDGLVRNPALMVVASTGAIIARLSAELGLTPSGRSRIDVPTEHDDEIARRYLS